ncbi:MAG: Group 1 glycosyl transferase [Candidatus Woesebacteria bacterium GW2011_GWA1_39_8]|uniref:Group 1 glycosyl transferase n=2 Tax=Candidatus Woeseibacteriota TaxID=1752722 RepID=A0A0G0PPU5_9BACT|nr:MAG: Group 1 glycosyl transferase [Candidatus Woesebacteria bacterium GW2011_GWA1_39_8]
MAYKVLMLGWELYPFNSGGLGEACLGLANALSKKGIDLTFVLPRKVDITVDGFRVVFADVDEDILKTLGAYTTSPLWSHIINRDELPPDFVRAAFKYAEKMKKLVKKQKADIIHTHDWMTYPSGVMAKSYLKKPMVAHVHSTEYDRTGGYYPNPYVYKIEKEGLLSSDRVLPVGGFMKEILVKNYGVDEQKIRVVYNGINEDFGKRLPPALTKFKELGFKIVLFLGRITLQKGPEYFVRAAKLVSAYNPKTLFVVAGSGDMDGYMMSEAARLGVMDKFLFTGFLRGNERNQIFQSADIFVMPSVSEPFGIVALEAAISGTPVLVSKQSGVAEVMKNILKADFWDIEEMANKILAVLKFDALPQDLKWESGKEVRNFSWSRAADEVINVYDQLI